MAPQITLFSETDPYGTITFANEAFCQVSKYSKQELIGKSHNIIRHPDMPDVLFRNLWTDIKQQKIFRAIIKNMAKDGSHYWVRAIISPVSNSSDSITRYTGIRHLINDEREAELLFCEQLIALNRNLKY